MQTSTSGLTDDQAIRKQIGEDVMYVIRTASQRILNPFSMHKLLGDNTFDLISQRFDAFIVDVITLAEQRVRDGQPGML